MLHELTFEWIGGNTCAADHMKKTFAVHGIRWHYTPTFALVAALNGSDFVPVEYYHISGETYGITEKPARTSEYFGIPAEELYQKKTAGLAEGWTREECLIMDHTLISCPFSGSLCEALEEADYHRRKGYYDSIEIVEMLDGKTFAVLAH